MGLLQVLSTPGVPPDQRAMATFVLTVIVNNSRPGQSACLSGNLLSICLQQVPFTLLIYLYNKCINNVLGK